MKELRSRPKFDYQFDTLNLIDKLFYSELKRRNKIIKEKLLFRVQLITLQNYYSISQVVNIILKTQEEKIKN